MLAVVKPSAEAACQVLTIPRPDPQAGQVLVRVWAVGICGTDLPIFSGQRKVPYPLVPGHEFAGEVVSNGPGAHTFVPGDRVTAGLVAACGECPWCRKGQESLCDQVYKIGISGNGGFAQYVAVPEKTLHHLPDSMTFAQGASIDPVASAYRPISKARIKSNDLVVIVGPGPIGLYALQLARAEGAMHVAVLGAEADGPRLDLAQRLGADMVLDVSRKDPAQAVQSLFQNRLADVVIEAAGSQSSLHTCLQVAKKQARICLVGLFHHQVAFDAGDVVRKELSIQGSICYTREDFQTSLDLVAAGRVQVDPLITHTYALTDIHQAIQAAEAKTSVKAMILPNQEME